MTVRKDGQAKVWLVLASLIMIFAGMSGILSNTLGVFFSAMVEDIGFRTGDLSVYYMIKSLVGAAAVTAVTRLFVEKNGKQVLLVTEILFIASFAVLAFFDHLWQWYLAAVVSGIGGSCYLVAVSIVINNWFVKRRGLALGLTMSSSGIAGALLSPVFSRLIGAVGWRQSVLITSAACAVLILVPTMFLFQVSPQESGLQPYGAEEAPVSEEVHTEGVSRFVPGFVFAIVAVAMLLPGTLVNFTAQMPIYALSLGYTLEAGAVFTSYCMIGNVVGKLLLGVISDRIGIYRTTEIFLLAVLASMILFRFAQSSLTALNLAAVLFGAEYAIYVNSQPLVLLDIYGPEAYKLRLSRLQSVLGFIGAFVAVIVPYIYDFTGSFNLFFSGGIVFCIIAFALFIYLDLRSRRNTYAGSVQ